MPKFEVIFIFLAFFKNNKFKEFEKGQKFPIRPQKRQTGNTELKLTQIMWNMKEQSLVLSSNAWRCLLRHSQQCVGSWVSFEMRIQNGRMDWVFFLPSNQIRWTISESSSYRLLLLEEHVSEILFGGLRRCFVISVVK